MPSSQEARPGAEPSASLYGPMARTAVERREASLLRQGGARLARRGSRDRKARHRCAFRRSAPLAGSRKRDDGVPGAANETGKRSLGFPLRHSGRANEASESRNPYPQTKGKLNAHAPIQNPWVWIPALATPHCVRLRSAGMTVNLTRQSILLKRRTAFSMEARVKPAHDESELAATAMILSAARSRVSMFQNSGEAAP
jgi:hypothetical protein